MDLILTFLGNIWALGFVILFLGGSIFVHELGHFLVARWRGMKVLRFSIGFGPRLFGWKGKDGIDYRVSWLPFGGYVALPQLADMQMVEGATPDEVGELPEAGWLDKVLVAVAGAVFNVIFALVLATVLWMAGRPEPESITSTTVGYVWPKLRLPDGTAIDSPAAKAGLQPGDRIVAVDGRAVTDWPALRSALVLGIDVDPTGERLALLTIERDGQRRDVAVSPVRTGSEKFRQIGVASAYQPIVDSVVAGTAASKLDLRPGDRFATIAGQSVHSVEFLTLTLEGAATDTVELGLLRDGAIRHIQVPKLVAGQTHPLDGVRITTAWKLRYQSPLSQFTEVIDNSFRTLRSLVHPRGDLSLSNLSGPIGMGRNFWDAAKSDYPIRFAIWIAVLVNISLAVFNLLPIPVLDGGHIVLATITKLRGRPLPPNLVIGTQSVFVILLFGMMIYVTIFGDLRRMVSDYRADVQAKEAAEKQKAAEPAKP